MSIDEILAQYPALQNEQSGITKSQLIEALGKAKKSGKVEMLTELKAMPLGVSKVWQKGKRPELFLSNSFVEYITNNL